MDTLVIARSEDPELQTLGAVLAAWVDAIGVGSSNARTAAQILAEENTALRDSIDAMGVNGKASPSRSLGNWLRNKKGSIVGEYRFECNEQGKHAASWYVETGGLGVSGVSV